VSRSDVRIDVIWDGTRVYRVPSPGEIEAILLLSQGLDTRSASRVLGLGREGARHRANEAQSKLRALSAAGALYQMYRLQIVPSPRDGRLSPVLDPDQYRILDVLGRLGLPYDQAGPVLRMGKSQLIRRVKDVNLVLGATNHVQALRRAVAHGDIEIPKPIDLWRGVV
jgi:hypothetical protein